MQQFSLEHIVTCQGSGVSSKLTTQAADQTNQPFSPFKVDPVQMNTLTLIRIYKKKLALPEFAGSSGPQILYDLVLQLEQRSKCSGVHGDPRNSYEG